MSLAQIFFDPVFIFRDVAPNHTVLLSLKFSVNDAKPNTSSIPVGYQPVPTEMGPDPSRARQDRAVHSPRAHTGGGERHSSFSLPSISTHL